MGTRICGRDFRSLGVGTKLVGMKKEKVQRGSGKHKINARMTDTFVNARSYRLLSIILSSYLRWLTIVLYSKLYNQNLLKIRSTLFTIQGREILEKFSSIELEQNIILQFCVHVFVINRI